MTSTRVELETVDVHDEAMLRQWWEVGAAASAERPYDAWPAWEVARRACHVRLRRPRPPWSSPGSATRSWAAE